MEIEVYDTYARSEEGLKIHFDVMLPIGGDEATAQDKAREFIDKISETANPVQLESCRFCHTEIAKTGGRREGGARRLSYCPDRKLSRSPEVIFLNIHQRSKKMERKPLKRENLIFVPDSNSCSSSGWQGSWY